MHYHRVPESDPGSPDLLRELIDLVAAQTAILRTVHERLAVIEEKLAGGGITG